MQKSSYNLRALVAALALGLCAVLLFSLSANSQERLATPAPAARVTITGTPITGDVNVTDAMMLAAGKDGGENWLLHGRTYDSQSFSPLTQVNKFNVTKLKPVAIMQTGVTDSFENTPIEVNGFLYIVTARNHVQAYNAVTGEAMWAYNPVLDPSDICCGPQAKGVAVAYGKVFVPQVDGKVVALDAKTGEVVWTAKQADILPTPNVYYSFTSAPQVYDGMVLVGNAGSEYPTRGFVEALDANTGKLMWRFSTTAAPDDPGGGPEAWAGDSWKVGGGSVWDTPAIDPKNGLAIFAVCNPNPDYQGETRLGNNLYTNSIVAVDVHTGKIKWYLQEVPHDLWDYDAVGPVVLFDVKVDGKVIPAAAEGGKFGYLFIVNRLTGELLHKTAFVKHSDNMLTVPTATQSAPRYPGISGGSLWSPPAYSPLTHNEYIQGVNWPWSIITQPLLDTSGGKVLEAGQQTGGGQRSETTPFKPYGNVTAINVDTGNIAWQVDMSLPMYGGVLATASNIIFTGEETGFIDAMDARTGKLLWHYQLGAGVCTPPITYRVKGVQYIAVSASGCQLGRVLTKAPRALFGDVIAIFALPGK